MFFHGSFALPLRRRSLMVMRITSFKLRGAGEIFLLIMIGLPRDPLIRSSSPRAAASMLATTRPPPPVFFLPRRRLRACYHATPSSGLLPPAPPPPCPQLHPSTHRTVALLLTTHPPPLPQTAPNPNINFEAEPNFHTHNIFLVTTRSANEMRTERKETGHETKEKRECWTVAHLALAHSTTSAHMPHYLNKGISVRRNKTLTPEGPLPPHTPPPHR
jgi:hypothetical protein